ncbi:Oidioi.mRNA.OKI2018_I69.chr1.g3438.t1.cds [Oikopleura dioica]|uniref:Oidioi.mRNA.OKI2018_I69.chr1.g3438.t1.cds n=1 Tax=Oikopleura dioica TaxID=34765 RepID=A0ABN7SVU4_OIKDI|nr:Oidioi.mRNA.OKI2018_I69.chr1.g3438.t1.cds [Oikopleura dioica]
MIFVIEQRLKDSQIEEERRQKVLREIVERFLSEEEIYNLGNFKEQFTKIAHCTTMKLNPVSMAKLFDLMTMAVKYQVFHCRNPKQMYLCLLNHFEDLEELFKSIEDRRVRKFFTTKVAPIFGDLSAAKWTILRRKILNDYQEHQIRVSLLLRRELQLEDARFVLKRTIPDGFQKPGTTKFYGAMEESDQVTWAMAGGPPETVLEEEKELQSAEDFAGKRNWKLGRNLYDEASQQPRVPEDAPSVFEAQTSILSNMMFEESKKETAAQSMIQLSVLHDEADGKTDPEEKPEKQTVRFEKEGDSCPTVNSKNVNSFHVQKLIKNLQSDAQNDKQAPEDDLLAMMDAL